MGGRDRAANGPGLSPGAQPDGAAMNSPGAVGWWGGVGWNWCCRGGAADGTGGQIEDGGCSDRRRTRMARWSASATGGDGRAGSIRAAPSRGTARRVPLARIPRVDPCEYRPQDNGVANSGVGEMLGTVLAADGVVVGPPPWDRAPSPGRDDDTIG